MNGLYDLLPGRTDFDDSKYKLGSLCRRNHDWMGTGQTLRLISGRHCPQCDKEKYEENLEKERQKARERMRQKRESMTEEELSQYRQSSLEYQRQRHSTEGRKSRSKVLADFVIPPHLVGSGISAIEIKAFIDAGVRIENIAKDDVLCNRQVQQAIRDLPSVPSVARLVMDEQQRYWDENPEAKKDHNRQWDRHIYSFRYKCDPLFRLHECQRNSQKKARNRGNHTVKISKGDLGARYAEFDNRCAFCNSPDRLTIEHVVARSKGGPHAMGNILPTCYRCNMSKRDHDVETWYRSQQFFNEARWRKICRVLGWQRSSIGQLALL